MKIRLLPILVLMLFYFTAQGQKTDFAVELAAFDQSVPLSYFKGIEGVYEAVDVNLIYRYHIAAATKDEATTLLQKIKQQGFPNARIIDFNYIKSVCEAQCGYVPPKPTGVGMKNSLNYNPTNTNNSNKTNIASTPKKTHSLSATDLLGNNAIVLPENFENEDADWVDFYNNNKNLGLTEEELRDIYKKHGNIKISQADWFVFKKDKDAGWASFKEKNNDLGATEQELWELYNLYGNIKISQAIWFDFKSRKPKNDNSAWVSSTVVDQPKGNAAEVNTIGFVMFDFGGVQLTNDAKAELDKLAAALSKNKNLNVLLTGHADAIGTDASNLALSERRANVVNQYLAARGVKLNQMQVVGKGESSPIAINNKMDGSDSPEGRKYNRRVDLLILDPDGNPVLIVSSISVPQHLRYPK